MSGWRNLPWSVSTVGETARSKALSFIEAFEGASFRIIGKTPIDISGHGEIRYEWQIASRNGEQDEHLDLSVETGSSIVEFDLYASIDGVEYDLTIRCSMELLDGCLKDPMKLLETGVDLLRRAAVAPHDAAPHPRRLEVIDAVRLARIAGIDWSTTFEAVHRYASPLSPAFIDVNRPGGGTSVPHPTGDAPTGTVLRTTMGGGIRLEAAYAARECDGFDAMEMLRIHRSLEDDA